ncbi:hypothetical protein CAJAP_01735 [Camponotus japonicus]
MESPNKMIKMDKDNDKESEPVNQNAYLRFMNNKEIMENYVEIMNNHKEIMKIHEKITKNYEKKLRIHKILRKILHNKHNISDKELEITRTDSIGQNVMNKFLELEGEMPKFVFEDQQYTEMIEKLCCNEDIHVKCQQDENKSIDKKQKIKHGEDESDIHIMLLNRIMKLYTEIEWWLQRVEENQITLMTLITEKHKIEIELMKLATKVTKFQNLCNSYEKEKTNLQLKNKNNKTSGMESSNLSTLQKSILEEENQQISPNTETNNAMELLKQISNSLNELFQNYEDKMEELNKCTVKVTELLKDQKTNDKSTFVEEQVPTFTEDLNKSDKADESSRHK